MRQQQAYSINNCGVSVFLGKIPVEGFREPQHVCLPSTNEKQIGGGDVEYTFKARKHNQLWWVDENQMLDIAFRKGFPFEEYNRVKDLGLTAAERFPN